MKNKNTIIEHFREQLEHKKRIYLLSSAWLVNDFMLIVKMYNGEMFPELLERLEATKQLMPYLKRNMWVYPHNLIQRLIDGIENEHG